MTIGYCIYRYNVFSTSAQEYSFSKGYSQSASFLKMKSNILIYNMIHSQTKGFHNCEYHSLTIAVMRPLQSRT